MRLAIRGEILTFLLGKIDGLYLRFLQLHQKLLLEGLDSPFQILDLAEDSRSLGWCLLLVPASDGSLEKGKQNADSDELVRFDCPTVHGSKIPPKFVNSIPTSQLQYFAPTQENANVISPAAGLTSGESGIS